MSSVTYKNQPGIDKSKGKVPLAGTSHLYTVKKRLWNDAIEDVLQGLFIGRTLHLCCGDSQLGDVRVDIDPSKNPNLILDVENMRSEIADKSFDTVLCDPPYNGRMQWNHNLLAEMSRIAKQRIIFQHWFIPATPQGLYKKAQEHFALAELYVWQPKTYFGRVQVVSVFDSILSA